jgi:hypothetical protein
MSATAHVIRATGPAKTKADKPIITIQAIEVPLDA